MADKQSKGIWLGKQIKGRIGKNGFRIYLGKPVRD
jgi:hypothetical protein